MAKLTAKDLDKMAGFDYEPPEPREFSPKVVAEFDTQKEAASFVKDLMKVLGSGASQGLADETMAAIKTGSISSPEYKQERNIVRKDIAQAKKNIPGSSIIEAAGGMATTAILPGARAFPALANIATSALQGAGEAEELEDIPKQAATSALLTSGMEVGGKALKASAFDDSTKILSQSVGAKASQTKMPAPRNIQSVVQRLNKTGFFKQGEVGIDPASRSFKRSSKSLTDLFKPQSLDSLTERANKSITALKDVNNKLIANKTIPEKDFLDKINVAIADMSFDPTGFNITAREGLARETADIIKEDLIRRGLWLPGRLSRPQLLSKPKKL